MSIRINALPADKLLQFDGVRRFLPNPVDPARLLFEGSFIEYGSVSAGRHSKEQRHSITVPLSFLSMFHTRSHWRDQIWFNQGQIAKTLRLKNTRVRIDQLKQQIMYDFADSNGMERQSNILPPAEAANLPKEANLSWLGKLPVGRLKLSWDEFVRFYLSTFGMLFYEIIKCAQDGGNLAHICKPERTRIVDGTLYVTPRDHIRDRGSILQLGILAADEDLRREVFRIARFVAGDAHGFRSSAYVPDFPRGTDKLYIQYYDGDENIKGSHSPSSSFKSIAKIRSDYRPAKFNQIIAELSSNQYLPLEQPSDEQDVHDIVRSFAEEDLRVSSHTVAGKHTVTVPVAWQNFRDGFPEYRNAKVILSHVDPPLLFPITLPKQLEALRHSDVTDSKNRSENGPARLQRSTRIWIDPKPPEKEVLRQAYLVEAAIPIWVPTHELPPRLKAFWKAANTIGGSAHSGDGKALCYQIPSSWGSFAQLRRGGARRFLYCSISVQDGEAYAIEFDKEEPGLPTSLGIIAKNDGTAMAQQEVFACVKSAVSHISQRERHSEKYVRVQTIWPNAAIYTDVRSTSLKHYNQLRDADRLANAVLSAAKNLLGYC